MHGQQLREVNEKDLNSTWRWLQKSDLKGCTEALICSAQEEAFRTTYIKFNIGKTSSSAFCRMCSNERETVSLIVSDCSVLAQRVYKRIHEKVSQGIYIGACVKNTNFTSLIIVRTQT